MTVSIDLQFRSYQTQKPRVEQKLTMGYWMWGDKTKEEIELERSGDIYHLQGYRYIIFITRNGDSCACPSDLIGLLQTELALRENTQREIALKAKMGELGEDSTDVTTAEDLQEELLALSKEYWSLERLWWEIRSSFPEGTLTRGIDYWRSQPKWYMHRVLWEDCIGRGGCCGRDCGCCSNRQSKHKFAAGHCTVECFCCEKARGFPLDPEQKSRIQSIFRPSNENTRPYDYRIKLASLLGLTPGNHENPVDLIVDLPPGCTPPSEEPRWSNQRSCLWKSFCCLCHRVRARYLLLVCPLIYLL